MNISDVFLWLNEYLSDARLITLEPTEDGIESTVSNVGEISLRSSFMLTLMYDSYIMFSQNNIYARGIQFRLTFDVPVASPVR